jgi:molybdopterin converting factor small subunit
VKVKIVCYGAMRDYLPEGAQGNRAEVDVPERATPEVVGSTIGTPKGLLYAVLVNGDQQPLHSELAEGDEVTLMPPFAGGDR